VLWLGDEQMNLEANGAPLATKLVTRWGFPFHATTLDLRGMEDITLSYKQSLSE
jgi:hypothetical protein